jgi:hypothetical protein
MGRPWWAKVAFAMWPSTVVVANVFRKHHTQVLLTEDQHAVGESGSESSSARPVNGQMAATQSLCAIQPGRLQKSAASPSITSLCIAGYSGSPHC